MELVNKNGLENGIKNRKFVYLKLENKTFYLGFRKSESEPCIQLKRLNSDLTSRRKLYIDEALTKISKKILKIEISKIYQNKMEKIFIFIIRIRKVQLFLNIY